MTCYRTMGGVDYLGNSSVSANGKKCQLWTSELKSQMNKYAKETSKACRWLSSHGSPVCDVGNGTVEECDIKFCGMYEHYYALMPYMHCVHYR